MKAVHLKTEYLVDPVGIDILKPRLFWNCEGGVRQSAYRIVAERGNRVVWDTGKVESNRMARIEYGGKPLNSRAVICWKVKLWDETGAEGEWSIPASFEMGLLNASDWSAKWITGSYSPDRKTRYPVDCFRKVFNCTNRKRARFYLTACGLYEARINGIRVGDFIMAPGFTDYRRRVQYQTYDVAALLREGENEITVLLADGWYRGSIGAMGVRNVYGKSTKLLAQLEMDDKVIVTDESWDWSNDGPILFADMKDGETVDLRKKPSYSGKARAAKHTVVPCASNNVAVREHERFAPVLSKTPSGKWLLDFKQNIAGYVEIKTEALAGQRLHMQFAERLNGLGELDMNSIQCRAGKPTATPKQEITLLCAGGRNRYKTKFAVFGFRYAAVETDIMLKADSISAIAVYSDMEQTGEFSCSNPLINRFVENTRWSMKGNFLAVPTDCPTRERAPWTGDVQIFCRTGSYLMETAAFLRKWLRDLRDRQTPEGKIPCHAPDVHNNEYFPHFDFIKRMDGCCGWADAAVLVPWRLYEMYGDVSLLAESYPSMKAHTLFQIGRTNRTGLFGKPFRKPDKRYISNAGQAFGEWLEAKDVYKQSVIRDFCAPHPEEATAYLSYICGIMEKAARKLKQDGDVPLFREYHDGCRKAYARQFTPVDTDRQSKLVRPLALGVLDGAEAEHTFRRLVAAIEKRNYRIGTGFLSTPLILPLLTRKGRTDIAYKMMENEEQPGWLYEVKRGATTVWENWDGSASRNHYSPGSVCQWLFETVGGIRMGEKENSFILSPKPGGAMKYADVSYQSVYGRVECRWKKADSGTYSFEIAIPANTTAVVALPGRAASEISGGRYSFQPEADVESK